MDESIFADKLKTIIDSKKLELSLFKDKGRKKTVKESTNNELTITKSNIDKSE
jgi:hypothetical protein